MRTEIEIIEVLQINGVRYIATTVSEARRVDRDSAVIDSIDVLACVDVSDNGQREWDMALASQRDPAGRHALREHLADLEREATR